MSDFSAFAADLSPEQREQAILHATALEHASSVAQENSERRSDIDRKMLHTLSMFALILAGSYRRIASAGKVEP